MAAHMPDVAQMITDGRLCVGVIGSHSNKPLFRRERTWTPPEDAKWSP
jgi:hypothetical protein